MRRPRGAHRVGDREREAQPPVERTAPTVVATVRDGRQELVDQVAVRRVDLEHVEPGTVGARGAGRPRRDVRRDAGLVERLGDGVARVQRQRARADHRPRPLAAGRVGLAERAVPFPPALQPGLAAGVPELDARRRAAEPDRVGDRRERRDLRVVPQAEVAVRVATPRLDRRAADEHQRGPPEREAREVDPVPVVGQAVGRRVLLHRRDDDPVAQREAAQSGGLEQGRQAHRRRGRPVTSCRRSRSRPRTAGGTPSRPAARRRPRSGRSCPSSATAPSP